MKATRIVFIVMAVFALSSIAAICGAAEKKATSYSPVDITKPFADTMAKMKADKAAVMKKHEDLLQERYDLQQCPAQGVTMTRGKAVQEGVRAKLPQGMTWEKLAAMSPPRSKDKDLFPKGFLPLPHPNHPEGGMVFPKFHIDEIKKQTGRDLTRFDLDFDLPDHFLPEFPPAIFLTTRPDLGDVSKGKVVTTDNYFELFDGI